MLSTCIQMARCFLWAVAGNLAFFIIHWMIPR